MNRVEQQGSTLAPMHILLTDDNPVKRGFLRSSLLAAFPSARIRECEDGAQALDYFIKHDVNLVVTDQNMPGMRGTDLVSALRMHDSFVPVVVVSITEEALTLAIARGADLFIGAKELLNAGELIRSLVFQRGFSHGRSRIVARGPRASGAREQATLRPTDGASTYTI